MITDKKLRPCSCQFKRPSAQLDKRFKCVNVYMSLYVYFPPCVNYRISNINSNFFIQFVIFKSH